MIISVEEAKNLINFKDWSDDRIQRKLKAIEMTIRKYTNNNFQDRAYRKTADIVGGLFNCNTEIPFKIGDTIQISESEYNSGLYTILSASDFNFSVVEDVKDETDVLITKIKYPEDVVECALNLLDWEINNRAKVGIKSETLSRHSVTYEDSTSMFLGYPVGILNGVKLHKKVRF